MATAKLTRGAGYFAYYRTFYDNSSSGDWTWYIGQWSTDYWNEADYGAGAVAYSVPSISDSLLSRTITIPCTFYNQSGACKVYAVLSTTKPTDDLSFRYGPTSGVISNEVLFKGGDTTSLSFTLNNGVNVSGKTIYMYMYRPNEGFGTNGTNSSVVTKSFSDGTITYTAPYKLSISAGTGSTITVNRTSSGAGATGNIAHNATLYYGDKLRITFAPKSNYKLLTNTVNSKTFTSGNTHTVSGDVTVSATAQPLASDIGATDANIESTSTITITRYDSTYTHTLTYSFGGASGTIVSKTKDTSIAWTVPASFYAQIPNAKKGTCTITCETFSGSTSLGKSSCSFTATAAAERCAPSVAVSIYDSNSTTVALTGDDSILVRYLSDAVCTISATARNGAKITTLKINDTEVTSESPSITYENVERMSFSFLATDSRGYTTSHAISPNVIKYVKLTINPILSRPSPTSGEIAMSFNGKFYNSKIGSHSNTLTIRYRYRAASESEYSEWITVDSTNYTKSTSTYSSNGAIILKDENGKQNTFDYRHAYVFDVQAYDGVNDQVLSKVTLPVVAQQGIPVFDWGESDFNVNGVLNINSINVMDIVYPVGAVYMHSSNTLPTTIDGIGSWSSVSTGISGVYAWKRTA